MGKRGAHKRKHFNKSGDKKLKGEWKVTNIPQDNQLFRSYYKLQIPLPQQQFNMFWKIMKEKLPVVFRVNPNYPNYTSFCKKLMSQQFLKAILQKTGVKNQISQQKEQGMQTQLPKLECLKWYPGNIVYEINTTKQQFKKSQILSQLHKYLQRSFDSGLISRQQLVSMLPPLYLQVNPDDIILDMCAAPGSKTSQILQMIYGQKRFLAKGCVIANDADYSRAQMLIHQIHRAGTAGMAVINHPGQFLPELYVNKTNSIRQKFQFDKILCDVPCSGDGATRKIPIKWVNWHTSDGMVLHPLQLAILMKSINLLKRGGLLVYSTCSLNPMEDQAVLSALFKKVSKGLEIIDIHKMYNVKGHRGLLNWKVCGVVNSNEKDQNGQTKKELKVYNNYQQAKENYKIKETLFPPSQQQCLKIGIQNTMRILPHDQNSGGFYIALLKKHQNFEWKYACKNQTQKQEGQDKNIEQMERKFVQQNLPQLQKDVIIQNEPQNKQQEEIQQQQSEEDQKNIAVLQNQNQIKQSQNNSGKHQSKWAKKKGSKYQKFTNLEAAQFEAVQNFFGLSSQLSSLLYVRDNAQTKRKVLLVSEGVRQFLNADTANKIKLVNMGCKVFEKGKQSFAGHQCLYRLCQQGIHFILPFMQKRKVKVPFEFFKKVLSIHSLTHEDIQDQQVRQKIRQITQGSFCIFIDQVIQNKRVVDAMVGQNFKNSFHLMVSKEDIASLNIRYL